MNNGERFLDLVGADLLGVDVANDGDVYLLRVKNHIADTIDKYSVSVDGKSLCIDVLEGRKLDESELLNKLEICRKASFIM